MIFLNKIFIYLYLVLFFVFDIKHPFVIDSILYLIFFIFYMNLLYNYIITKKSFFILVK